MVNISHAFGGVSRHIMKNQVKSMEIGASNTEAQVSPTVVAVI
jgi:hypothetical protein